MRNLRFQSKRSHEDVSNNRENIYGGYDYRTAYLNQNRGIFGYLYICSQCFLPILNKKTLKVDHIIPPSRFAKKKKKWGKDTGVRKATLISNVLNNTFNCVTICPSCNPSKGNKMDHRILKGIAAKAIELSLSAVQLALSASLFLSLHLIRAPFVGAGWVLRSKRKGRGRR